MQDWAEWHRRYDEPEHTLARRLDVVRQRLGEALDRTTTPTARLLSLCAGEGRDVIPVLAARRATRPAIALLVERDPELARRAGSAAATEDLDGVAARCADAGDPSTYADWPPVDVLLLCGIFGNVSEEDIRTTVAAVEALAAPGATVIWTRGCSEPDLRPAVRSWFTDAGHAELSFDGHPEAYGVGVNRVGTPAGAAAPRPERLFTFLR